MISTLPLPYPASTFDLFQTLRSLSLPVLLHSGDQDNDANARFDILVAEPTTQFRYQEGTLLIVNAGQTQSFKTTNPIMALAQHIRLNPGADERREDLPFCGGFVGYFAYDALGENYKLSGKYDAALELPAVLGGIYDWAVIVDHLMKVCTLVSQAGCDSVRRERILSLLRMEHKTSHSDFTITSSFESNFSAEAYYQAFEQVMSYIQAGDCYQVNLAQCFQASCRGDSFEYFVNMQGLARAPFAAYMEDGKHSVMSFSPERFLRVSNKKVTAQPIKGTRPRSGDRRKDAAALTELCNSSKDRAENLMIVDLLRNDLGKVCRTGSVQVESLFKAHSFSNVHHLISTINGELKQSDDVFALLSACFPGGSITGTPKFRAMEIINELETMPRSVYCGSIVWVDHTGDMDSNIAIRTVVRDQNRLFCWGGGGIVADSEAQLEYQESLDKISVFMGIPA